jgi:hypothetical protein
MLMDSIIYASLLFNGVAILIVSFLDSRRGRKDFWLWRRVERAEGEAGVGLDSKVPLCKDILTGRPPGSHALGNYWTGNEPVLYALGQVITVLCESASLYNTGHVLYRWLIPM